MTCFRQFDGLPRLLLALSLPMLLAGCVALAYAPLAAGMLDKSAAVDYRVGASKATVFNAALKAITTKGSAESVDRETGTIRASLASTSGLEAYVIVVSTEEETLNTSKIRISVNFAGGFKINVIKSSQDVLNEVVADIERALGSKLEKL